MSRALLLGVLLFAAANLTQSALGQTRRVQLINADSVVVETIADGAAVRRLFGNVRLREDTIRLRADRAIQNERLGEVRLDGAVRVVAGEDTLTADGILYDTVTKDAVADGNARVTSGPSVLFAPRMRYNTRTRVALFSEGGRLLHDGAELLAPNGTYQTDRRLARVAGSFTLRDSASTLTAARGTYDARLQRADVAGEVRLDRTDATLDADSAVYFRRTERARAFGRVVIRRFGENDEVGEGATVVRDSSRQAILFGHRALFDGQADIAEVEGRPTQDDRLEREALLMVIRRNAAKTDTTLARAPRLFASREEDEALRRTVVIAFPIVRVVRNRLAARADSIHVLRMEAADSLSTTARAATEDIRLLGVARPSVWFDGAQLTGDSIRAVSPATGADSLRVWGRAFAAKVDSTLGRVNQLAGQQMLALVRDDSLRLLSVWQAARAIIFQADDAGRLAGAAEVGADSLAFLFRKNALREVTGSQNITGTSFGPAIVPDPLRLDGYVYVPGQRPRREDLLRPDEWEALWLRTGTRYEAAPTEEQDDAPREEERTVNDEPSAEAEPPHTVPSAEAGSRTNRSELRR